MLTKTRHWRFSATD